jgi:hypothetical protein
LSQIFTNDERNLPLKYLDRIADFFGLATYQLFQPGISARYERRKAERRTGRDRRVSALNHQVRESVAAAISGLTPVDVADLLRLRSLPAESRDAARTAIQALERSEREIARRGRRVPRVEKVAASEAHPTGHGDPRKAGNER